MLDHRTCEAQLSIHRVCQFFVFNKSLPRILRRYARNRFLGALPFLLSIWNSSGTRIWSISQAEANMALKSFRGQQFRQRQATSAKKADELAGDYDATVTVTVHKEGKYYGYRSKRMELPSVVTVVSSAAADQHTKLDRVRTASKAWLAQLSMLP